MPDLFERFARLKFVEREDYAVSSTVGERRDAVRGGDPPVETCLTDARIRKMMM
jgi:hypothetical protein